MKRNLTLATPEIKQPQTQPLKEVESDFFITQQSSQPDLLADGITLSYNGFTRTGMYHIMALILSSSC